jgi:thiol-disulfide isomerase/thioredoxin
VLFRSALIGLAVVGIRSADAGADERPGKPKEVGSIAGKVTDEAGRALAGAQVTLYRLHRPGGPRWGKWRPAGAPVASDRDGKYSFNDLSEGVYMPAVKKDGFAPWYCPQRFVESEPLEINVVLKPPATPVIQVTDEAGRPVAGARVRQYELSGAGGESYLSQLSLRSLGLEIAASDDAGRLQLPPLPRGDRLTATIEHPRLAPARVADATVDEGVVATAMMKPGVTLRLRASGGDPANRIESAVIDLRHEPIDHPSTTIYCEVEFDADGAAQRVVEPGDYQFLLLQHPDFFLTPALPDGDSFRISQGCNDDLTFEVRPKVLARGRVIDAETGKPVRDIDLMGEIGSGKFRSPPAGLWSFAEWANDRQDGTYSIHLAAGPARIGFFGAKSNADETAFLTSDSKYVEFTVAADGSTVIPDIRVHRLPKLAGIVRNPDGSPAARAIVCLAGWFQPVLSDEQGRFEIQPTWIPIDSKGERQYEQRLIALDPYRPLAARRDVRLDKPGDLMLALEPHPLDWPLEEFDHPSADSKSLAITTDKVQGYADVSLRGRPAPAFDSAAWINTDGKPLTLEGLRGKYVLLDFWMMSCGPCHADFPSVQMVHDLYKDRGVVVVGVHNNNYSTVDEVREHVAKLGLTFPIVVDHLDGRTIAKYQRHALARAYPNYVLIGPDGNVLLDDCTIAYPRGLHGYKLEIIRRFLLASPAKVQASE